MAKRGRPLALDETKKREICALVTAGCTRTAAANYVGCALNTIVNAARRDKAFADRLRQAELLHQLGHLRNIQAAGEKSWRASAWLLTRRYPHLYSYRGPDTVTRDELNAMLDGLVSIVVEQLSAEHQQRFLDRIDEMREQSAANRRAERELAVSQ